MDLADARRILGESSRLWVGDGTHVVGDGWWAAMSGEDTVDYNVLCWSEPDPDLTRGFALIKDIGAPAVQMLAGPGLAAAQDLSDAGWICIGTTPVMSLDLSFLHDGVHDPAVQRIGPAQLPAVRLAVEEAFALTPELARVAIPDGAVTDEDMAVWALIEDDVVKSCLVTVRVEGTSVFWSMATPKAFQRQGLGSRVLRACMLSAARDGADWGLCYASTQGEPLYVALGFEIMEHWQIWSRPRWVLGRA